MYRLLVLLLLAGTANATTVTQQQLVMGGVAYSQAIEGTSGIGLPACVTAALQGVATPNYDECWGTVSLEKFSAPVSNVQMLGTGFVADVFDGAVAVAFDAQGNYLGSCTADTVFDTYSAPQFPSACSNFMGKSTNDHNAYGWSEQFSAFLPFDGITYVAIVPMSDGGTAGSVTGFTDHAAVSTPEPATMLLVGLGLAMAVRRRNIARAALKPTSSLAPSAEQ